MITVFHTQRDYSLKRVAQVKTDDLEVAWYKTNSIDFNWWKHEDVDAFVVPCRSSMVDDIFFNHADRHFYRVASVGFERIENWTETISLTLGELRALFDV